MIRIGKVSSVNADNDSARVNFSDIAIVSAELKIIRQPIQAEINVSCEHAALAELTQWFPRVGEKVICAFLDGGQSDGFIIGGV